MISTKMNNHPSKPSKKTKLHRKQKFTLWRKKMKFRRSTSTLSKITVEIVTLKMVNNNSWNRVKGKPRGKCNANWSTQVAEKVFSILTTKWIKILLMLFEIQMLWQGPLVLAQESINLHLSKATVLPNNILIVGKIKCLISDPNVPPISRESRLDNPVNSIVLPRKYLTNSKHQRRMGCLLNLQRPWLLLTKIAKSLRQWLKTTWRWLQVAELHWVPI